MSGDGGCKRQVNGSWVPVAGPAGKEWADMLLLRSVGLRFTGLSVPAGATITSAFIQFSARRSSWDASDVHISIHGDDSEESTIFQSEFAGWFVAGQPDPDPSVPNVISKRITDSDLPVVDWTITEQWTEGQSYNSADVSSIVQQMVDSNAHRDVMTFMLQPAPQSGDLTTAEIQATREAVSHRQQYRRADTSGATPVYDASARAPALVLTWTV
jgi:hypothetical protein